ncbi:hypothetical protein FN846DRAFT_236675 [Sphaerosporella brunnea]|uniref:Uncharacterized protein n=1 Tax=Sphaerosporella brunnea TaxID=1250544 RepID=A0A5J5FBX5_9PEZI|nr:hypothetical protein FN846DRAFT_236675 [Sphaerosporella brunnea]
MLEAFLQLSLCVPLPTIAINIATCSSIIVTSLNALAARRFSMSNSSGSTFAGFLERWLRESPITLISYSGGRALSSGFSDWPAQQKTAKIKTRPPE